MSPQKRKFYPLVLGSGSPRRRELLERVGLLFSIASADIDESVQTDEAPLDYVRRLATEKATAIFSDHRDSLVLAADTMVSIGTTILGKPDDNTHATAMISELSGQTHQVTTAFALIAPIPNAPTERSARTFSSTTDVTMRPLTKSEIVAYVASGEWRGKAGGYAIQGIGAALVASVCGSVTNVIGLPLAEVLVAIEGFGGPLANYPQGTPV